MSIDLFKELLPAIRETKKDILNETNAGDYIPFIVNTALSVHLDTLFYANDMNLLPGISPLYQFKYLSASIRPIRRDFQPWPKKHRSDAIQAIMKFFNISWQKAIEASKCLTEEQINDIAKAYED